MHSRRSQVCAAVIILISLALSACTTANPPAVTPTSTTSAPTSLPATPTATPVPPRELTICQGQEPQSLYVNVSSTHATWSVLQAIYDGPIDIRDFQNQPVILKDLPSQANGDAVVSSVAVQRGQEIMDANGNLAYLDTGVSVLPAGCTDASCAVPWDGTSPLQMDQLSLTYRLLPGLLWSDGQPLTAGDSVYAYQVAADPQTPTSKQQIDQTASYQATDDQTVVWTGVPGFIPTDMAAYFWLPFPQHAWSKYTTAQLLTADEVNRTPMGWGPYIIKDWVQGDHIDLVKNPNYFRASEGLPKFDQLTFRFLGEPPDNNLAALTSGQCDLLDQTIDWDGQLSTLTDLQQKGDLKIYSGMGPEWEHVDFGIKLAAYDNGYTPYGNYRSDIFSDVRVRQAFAYCMDRQSIIDKLLYGLSQVPASFFSPTNPLYDKDLTPLPYDPQKGGQLLDEAGWVDQDNDPSTPRQAVNVATVLSGTPLSVNLILADSRLHEMAANILTESMSACGIQVNVKFMDTGDLYAPGPDGPLFGRNFDLAEFSWQSGSGSPCFLYTSSQIPSAENNWLGVNVTGFSDSTYDAACAAAMKTNPGQADAYQQANQSVQELFAEDMPVVPLYYPLKIDVARPDLCGFSQDVSATSELWNLESFDTGEACSGS